jgi:hypothetical protein
MKVEIECKMKGSEKSKSPTPYVVAYEADSRKNPVPRFVPSRFVTLRHAIKYSDDAEIDASASQWKSMVGHGTVVLFCSLLDQKILEPHMRTGIAGKNLPGQIKILRLNPTKSDH